MRRAHAAALALVGWYLMLPPLKREGPPKPSTPVKIEATAPLSRWHIISTGKPFKRKRDCEAYSVHLTKLLQDPKHPGAAYMARRWFEKSLCVRTNDPRLAK